MAKMISNNKAFTMAEMLTASVIIVLLFASILGALVLTKSVYSNSIAKYNLQRDVDTVMQKMIRGIKEPGGSQFGLRSAVSYTIPVAIPAQSKIDFVGTDTNHRNYFLNNNNNTIVYLDPTLVPNQQIIYKAPANSSITLYFSSIPAYGDMEVVRIYLSVSQIINNRNVAGSLTTDVTLRNAPK